MEGAVSVQELIAAIGRRHGDDPHQALTAARELADQLTITADDVLGHFVTAARSSDLTWTEIGDVLGVSKQAVQKRYAARSAEAQFVIGEGLFSRFDDALSEAIIRATLSAGGDGTHQVTSNHLLASLASLRNGRAAAIIRSLAPHLAASLASSRSRPGAMRRRRGALPFALDARATFNRLESIAEERDLTEIRTEHLLLALAVDPLSEVGARLQADGVTPQRVEQILG